MTLNQFVDKWNGKKADWDGAYAGQCVDLFRYYCDEVLGIRQPAGVWGAGNFWSDFASDPVLVANFTQMQNTADFIPKEGDVAIWNFSAGGGFGHIAIVVGKDHTTSYFNSFDQNWSRVSYCELVKHNYTNIFGFLRPKKELEMAEDMMQIAKSTFEKLVGNSTKYDEFVKAGYSQAQQVIDQKADLDKKVSDYAKTIESQDKTIFTQKEDIRELENALATCESQVQEIPSLEEYTKDYTPTGRRTIEVQGDLTVETTYKLKD